MQIRVAVGMLAALVVVLLAPSMTDGLVLTRCALKQKLNETLPANMSGVFDKIVCSADLVSGLNTSKVVQIAPRKIRSLKPDSGPKHDKPDNSNSTAVNQTVLHNDDHDNSGLKPPKPNDSLETGKGVKPKRGRQSRSLRSKPGPKPGPKPDNSAENHSDVKPPKPNTHNETSEAVDVVTLYGVFQLPDRFVCASGNKTTLNLCGLTCDKLIDDDITDDIICFRTLLSKFMSVGIAKGEHMRKLYDRLILKQCASVDAQFYSAC